MRVDASQSPGILITNGEFTAFTTEDTGGPSCSDCASSQVVIGSGNTGPVRFVESSFWGPSATCATIQAGSSGATAFVGCEFVNWDVQGGAQGRAAVYQGGSGPVTISNCDFQETSSDKPQLILAKDATKAVFMGNTLASGKEQVDDQTGGAKIVGLGTNV